MKKKLNFSKDKEATGFTLLEPGRYLCKVHEVATQKESGDPNLTNSGDEYWRLNFKVLQGPEAKPNGACAGSHVWDNVIFSTSNEKIRNRAKLVFKRFGFDVDGDFECGPEDLVGRTVVLDVIKEDREMDYQVSPGKYEKRTRPQNSVSFAGYDYANTWRGPGVEGGSVEARAAKETDDLPF